MDKIKKHAVWVIVIAIIVGVFLLFKSRKVASEPFGQSAAVSDCCAERPARMRL